MSNVTGIVNYGVAGNIYSIKKAVEQAGGRTIIINRREDFGEASRIIVPGVGSFRDAMEELGKTDMVETLTDNILAKPTLGICLGMQILAKLGFEYGKTAGLGIVDAEVKPMQVDAKVPHVGFNTIEIKKHNALLDGVEDKEFYFMHSYEMINYTDILSLTEYAGHRFVSAIQKDNIFGVQFHPEKSRDAGIRLFGNFLNI